MQFLACQLLLDNWDLGVQFTIHIRVGKHDLHTGQGKHNRGFPNALPRVHQASDRLPDYHGLQSGPRDEAAIA